MSNVWKCWTLVCVLSILAGSVSSRVAASDAASQQKSAASAKKLKMRIAVAPMDWSGGGSMSQWNMPIEFQNAIYEKLVKKLVDTGKFVVLEREALRSLLDEKAIKEDATGQSQKGKLTPAQAMIKGRVTNFTVAKRQTGGSVSISGVSVGGGVSEARVGIDLRIFGVDTGEVIAAEAAEGSSTAGTVALSANIGSSNVTFSQFEQSPLGKATNTAIDRTVQLIVKKLEDQPWTAFVADVDEATNEITLNAGSEMGLRVGETFEISRILRIVKDPESGEILGKRTSRIGLLRVTAVEPRFSIAETVEGGPFQLGDLVREAVKPKN